jgi:cytochrome c553
MGFAGGVVLIGWWVITSAGAEPVDERMETHWRLASAIEVETIQGNLDVVRTMAERIAALPTDALGPELEPQLEVLRAQATALSHVQAEDEAARAVAGLAAACGSCHASLDDAGPPVRLKAWPPTGDGEDTEGMVPHQEAADWMWIGIVAPSTPAWRRGARMLRKDPPDDPMRDLALLAEDASATSRTAIYADVLVACASCH